MKKGSYTFYIGIAISLVFVLYAVTQMDLQKAFNAMLSINPIWLLPYLAATFFSFYFRALRWWYIIEPIKPIPTWNLFSAISIGFMGNMIFPMRIGELIRAYVIAKKEKISGSGAFATVAIERMFDVLTTLILLLLTMMIATPKNISPETWGSLKTIGAVFTAVMLAAFSFFYFLANDENIMRKKISGAINLLPEKAAKKGAVLFDSFCGGLQVITKGGHLLAILAYSLVVWAVILLTNYFSLPMLDLPTSFETACVLTLLIVFAVSIPSSPGFIGPFHAAIVLALGFYGVDPDSALGAAIVIHLLTFTTTVAMGLFFLWREKMTLSEIKHSVD